MRAWDEYGTDHIHYADFLGVGWVLQVFFAIHQAAEPWSCSSFQSPKMLKGQSVSCSYSQTSSKKVLRRHQSLLWACKCCKTASTIRHYHGRKSVGLEACKLVQVRRCYLKCEQDESDECDHSGASRRVCSSRERIPSLPPRSSSKVFNFMRVDPHFLYHQDMNVVHSWAICPFEQGVLHERIVR